MEKNSSRPQTFLKTAIWVGIVFFAATVLFKLWIPNLTSFESPQWDESDRARDAMEFARAIRNLDLFKIFDQTILFQTWGPLYAVVSQVPIFFFGPEARSLAFVSFFAFVASGSVYFWSLKKALGVAGALAVCAFIFYWIAGFSGFGSYFIIFMLEGWTILGWIGAIIAGVTGSVPLLVTSLWILFLAKFQYFPVFFLSFVFYLLVNRRVSSELLRDFFKKTGVRIASAVLGLIVLHIVIMKVFGPIYGKPNWAGYRSLRNPLVASWIFVCAIFFVNRALVYKHLLITAWEREFTKWFFWPVCLLMCFPYPNRWGAIAVTQNYAKEKLSFSQTAGVYAEALSESWTWPQTGVVVLLLIVAAWLVSLAYSFRNKESRVAVEFKFAELPVFVVILFAVQLLVLTVGVNNTQPRYAWVALVSIPVGMLAYALNQMALRLRIGVSTLIVALVAFAFATTDYFQPSPFFFKNLPSHVGQPYIDHPDLFPIDRSLEIVLSTAAGSKSPFRLGVLQNEPNWYWDLPLRYWRVQNELKTGRQIELTILARKIEPTQTKDYCGLAKDAALDAFIESVKDAGGTSAWRTVSCP